MTFTLSWKKKTLKKKRSAFIFLEGVSSTSFQTTEISKRQGTGTKRVQTVDENIYFGEGHPVMDSCFVTGLLGGWDRFPGS